METNPMGKPRVRVTAEVVPLFRESHDAARLFLRAYRLDGDEGTWEVARNLYREVVRLLPDHVDAWNNLGALEHRLGDKASALDAYGQALLLNPEKAETHNNIGMLLQDERKFEIASVYLLRAVKLDPEMGEARVNLALCLQGLGRRNAALKHWRAYLERYPKGVWAALAEKHVRLCAAR
jgi:Flp pilus assembly protein TadD